VLNCVEIGTLSSHTITDRIAYKAAYRYCVYSKTSFSVYRLVGATRCTPSEMKFDTKEPVCPLILIGGGLQVHGHNNNFLKTFAP